MKSKSFTELIVWQKAHKFVLEVYKLTKSSEEISKLLDSNSKAVLNNQHSDS